MLGTKEKQNNDADATLTIRVLVTIETTGERRERQRQRLTDKKNQRDDERDAKVENAKRCVSISCSWKREKTHKATKVQHLAGRSAPVLCFFFSMLLKMRPSHSTAGSQHVFLQHFIISASLSPTSSSPGDLSQLSLEFH